MKHISLIIVAALAISGCGLLTPAVEQTLNNTGIAILCNLEEEELADPVLGADCDKLASGETKGLTPAQRASVSRHAAKARALRGSKPATDGGAP